MSHEAPVPLPALTVSAVAARLGVAPSTLRTWDRRYSLGPSDHTAGAHRRYSAADIARLMIMRRLTLEGVAPADAARIARATAVDNQLPDALLSGEDTYLPGVPFGLKPSGGVRNGKNAHSSEIDEVKQRVRFTPAQLASRSHDAKLRTALLEAATDFDEVAAIQLVHSISEVRGIADMWVHVVKGAVIQLLGSSDMVQPGMDPLSVIESAVMTSLRRTARKERERAAGKSGAKTSAKAQAESPTAPQIMVCAGPDEVSTVGAHVLAAALNQSGTRAAVLLGQVRETVLRDTLEKRPPKVIVVVAWTEPSRHMRAAVEYSLKHAPHIPVLLTGPGWPRQTPTGAHRVRTFIGALHEAQSYSE